MNKFIYLIFAFFGVHLAHATTIELAMAQYSSGKFSQAYTSFLDLAKLGNARAQFNLGVMFARGEHVKEDLVESLAWMYLVHEKQEKLNTHKAIELLENKLGKDAQKAAIKRLQTLREIYGEAAVNKRFYPELEKFENDDYFPAKLLLSNYTDYSKNTLDYDQPGSVDVEFLVEVDGSVRYPTILSSSGDTFGQAALEALLSNRFAPATFRGKAVHQYGNKMRFTFHMNEVDLDVNQVESHLTYLKQRAEFSGGSAKYSYAYAYDIMMVSSVRSHLSHFEQIQLENPMPWITLAAREGHSFAKYELGRCLAYGEYCQYDERKSLFWLEQAAQQNLAEAQLMLGMEFIAGARVKGNVSKGKQLIRQAASAGLNHAVMRNIWLNATAETINRTELNQAIVWFYDIDEASYPDKVSYYESTIALQLVQREYNRAKKTIKQAKKYLKKSKLTSFRLPMLQRAAKEKQRFVESI